MKKFFLGLLLFMGGTLNAHRLPSLQEIKQLCGGNSDTLNVCLVSINNHITVLQGLDAPEGVKEQDLLQLEIQYAQKLAEIVEDMIIVLEV